MSGDDLCVLMEVVSSGVPCLSTSCPPVPPPQINNNSSPHKLSPALCASQPSTTLSARVSQSAFAPAWKLELRDSAFYHFRASCAQEALCMQHTELSFKSKQIKLIEQQRA